MTSNGALVPLLVAGALVTACSGSRSAPVGLADDGWVSERTQSKPAPFSAPSHRTVAIPPERRQPWEHRGQLARWSSVGGRGPSEHLGVEVERTVRVNELASDYRQLPTGRPMPAGAIIVQLHHPPNQDEVVAAFVMHKQPDSQRPDITSWEYLVLDASLRVEARGKLPLCARCHALAPHDSLFGPPDLDR